uniref:WGS project CBMI000000000 data, contig CS3069_c002754 n=1 Tax=Fusarium clavum TaxID=2594811 RepID=A0A090MD55_9HYPO|nr:unnamed protein product [Fusarium clavum]
MEYLGPVFTQFGLTPIGPQAETIAAWIQSLYGSVPARSIYAIVQSAQMGGYGVEVIETAVGYLNKGYPLVRILIWLAHGANNTTCP